MRASILGLLVTVAVAGANELNVGDIFDIPQEGGCWDIYSPNDDTKELNHWWDEIVAIVDIAAESLDPTRFAEDYEIRKSLFNWFSITPEDDGSAPVRDPATHEASLRFSELRRRFEAIQELMSNAVKDNTKPKLFCGSDFLIYQTGSECALDHKGDPIMKQDSQECYTLKEWEILNGNEAKWENNWYWHYDISAQYPDPGVVGDHKYVINPKVPQYWNNGRPDFCSAKTLYGLTSNGDGNGGVPTSTTRSIFLCLKNFKREWLVNIETREQAVDGTVIADWLHPRSNVLFHEMFHLALPPYTTPDAHFWRCKDRDDKGNPDTYRWPDDPASWEDTGSNACWALQTLNLGLWERTFLAAHNNGYFGFQSLTNPESLVWWALTNYMHWMTGQDWSTGFCREAGSQAENPPPMKLANMNATNGTDFNMSAGYGRAKL